LIELYRDNFNFGVVEKGLDSLNTELNYHVINTSKCDCPQNEYSSLVINLVVVDSRNLMFLK